jgi:hypothetical protein
VITVSRPPKQVHASLRKRFSIRNGGDQLFLRLFEHEIRFVFRYKSESVIALIGHQDMRERVIPLEF